MENLPTVHKQYTTSNSNKAYIDCLLEEKVSPEFLSPSKKEQEAADHSINMWHWIV